jgi:hypothetical protein
MDYPGVGGCVALRTRRLLSHDFRIVGKISIFLLGKEGFDALYSVAL